MIDKFDHSVRTGETVWCLNPYLDCILAPEIKHGICVVTQ